MNLLTFNAHAEISQTFTQVSKEVTWQCINCHSKPKILHLFLIKIMQSPNMSLEIHDQEFNDSHHFTSYTWRYNFPVPTTPLTCKKECGHHKFN